MLQNIFSAAIRNQPHRGQNPTETSTTQDHPPRAPTLTRHVAIFVHLGPKPDRHVRSCVRPYSVLYLVAINPPIHLNPIKLSGVVVRSTPRVHLLLCQLQGRFLIACTRSHAVAIGWVSKSFGPKVSSLAVALLSGRRCRANVNALAEFAAVGVTFAFVFVLAVLAVEKAVFRCGVALAFTLWVDGIGD